MIVSAIAHTLYGYPDAHAHARAQAHDPFNAQLTRTRI